MKLGLLIKWSIFVKVDWIMVVGVLNDVIYN